METYYEEEEDEEQPMALIIEDDQIVQGFVSTQLKKMNIEYNIATTVTQAINKYKELNREGINIDLIFLDLLLEDGSNGIQFLQELKENNWLSKSLIFVMSGTDDPKTVKECYKYNIQNFLQKPITVRAFMDQSTKIKEFLKKIRCPIKGYKIIKEIGRGAFGIVNLVQYKKTKELFAMKEMENSNIRVDFGKKEINFLQFLKSPTIIGLKNAVYKSDKVYMILEYAPYGTIGNRISEKRKNNETFETTEILDWMIELIIGLYVIHKKGLMHRDIKSDNLFICDKDLIKIGDFGLARAAVNSRTVCGTALYMAPEIGNYKLYTNAIDIWAAGIVLYELVMLKKPFEGIDVDVVREKIMQGRYDVFPESVDPRLKRLLNLTLNQFERRASAEQLLSLPFVQERVKELFTTKINDDDLYNEISKIKPLSGSQLFPFEGSQEKKYYMKELKLAATLSVKLPSTPYSYHFYDITAYSAINEKYLEMYSDYNLELQELLNQLKKKGLLTVMNPKSNDEKYYRVEINEDESIDNSLKVPFNYQILYEEDPVGLSKSCLEQAKDLWRIFRYTNIKHKEQRRLEMLTSEALFEFYFSIKKLSQIKIFNCNSKQKLATMLNIYQTMFLHTEIKEINIDNLPTGTNPIWLLFGLDPLDSKRCEVTYNIAGYPTTLTEMKQIVLRRNKPIPGQFFRAAYSNDPRINFIDEPYNTKMERAIKLFSVFYLDSVRGTHHHLNELVVQVFSEEGFDQELDTHFKAFVKNTIFMINKEIFIPLTFQTYVNDFGCSLERMEQYFLRSAIGDKKNNKKIWINLYKEFYKFNFYKTPYDDF